MACSGGEELGNGSLSGLVVEDGVMDDDIDPTGWATTGEVDAKEEPSVDDGETTAASAGATGDAGEEICPAGAAGCPCNSGACGYGLECYGGTCVVGSDEDGDHDGGDGGDGGDDDGASQQGCPQDPYEPNESEGSALLIGQITDDDDDARIMPGKIGPGETDWWLYTGDDTFGSVANPQRNIASDGPIRVCKFVSCHKGIKTRFDGCYAGTPATSPSGWPGCCTTGSAVGVNYKCLFAASDDATIWFRVDNASRCTDYSITYHF